MKKIFPFLLRGVLVLAAMAASLFAEQEPVRAVAAEVWNFDMPEGVSAKSTFEQWRAQQPSGESKQLALDGLAIPAREENTMVRVAGVFIAPLSGDYAFTIHAPDIHRFHRPDETELWIYDNATGEWRLAQCTGNPIKSGGRTHLEAGVPRRYELWTMGRNRTVVDWEVVDFSQIDPSTGRATVKLARQMVPASALGPRVAAPDDKHADGLLDSWKQRHGLEGDDGMGPNGPWGDPDADNLPNWREQLAGTSPLEADTAGRAGLVRWETWRGIPGRYVFDLRRAGHFPAGPREVRYLDRLEIPTGNGVNYGSRVRGWLVAPADGEYRIGIRADDGAELWLGENETWQSKRRIAKTDLHVSGHVRWFHRNEKGENIPLDSEQIGRVVLKAGSRYYLEILHKQDTGSDECIVLWIKPGAVKPEVITKEHLVSWQPCPTDTDDDGLPDEWQRTAKLMDASVDPAMRQAEADPDLDGATNREEWLAGTDPLSKTESPPGGHLLTSETWTGIAGRSVSSLTSDGSYPAKPDFASRIDNLDFGNEGENYGVRLRGYLTAPKGGDYQFSISGNNACTLYLAASEDKFTKRVASRVEVGTLWRSFDLPGHSPSGPIPMESGRSYYIEVIYKRGVIEENKTPRPDPGDHSSVAWKRPGERSFSVIPPGVFTTYQPDPRDLDDDDLPDEWEKLHRLDPATPGGAHGEWGDPDGDGLDNFREYQLGLDPNATDVHGAPGLALYEAWDNIPGLPDAHREQSGLFPALRQDPRFPLEPTRREWRDTLEAPRRQGNDYGGRLRAHIIPPVTGDYFFSIAGRDVGVLLFSADGSKFNRKRVASIDHGTSLHSWDKLPGQISAPVRLEAGKPCYIEALIGRGGFPYNDDFFSIAWKPPGAEAFQVIGAEHITAFFRDPNDQDDDELPDDWEKRYNLDPTEPRGDHGPSGDPDRDGLTNMEEYQRGSDPRNGDTDGDGVSDADELQAYGSNPLVKDVFPPVEYHRFQLTSGMPRVGGPWVLDHSGALTSSRRRGTVAFEFDIEASGVHALSLEASAGGGVDHVPAVPVTVSINSIILGHADFPTQSLKRTWLTPWLPAGRHTVLVDNRNVRANVSLRIHSLTLSRFEDGDSRSGFPDWLAKLFSPRNLTDASDATSTVSPWSVEGSCRLPRSVSIQAGDTDIPAYDNFAGRWHANVPLSPDGSATDIAITFENGAVAGSHEMRWVTTNLATAPPANHLRVGDSIRVTAYHQPGSTFSLRLGERVWVKQAASDPVILTFDEVGTHTLEATLEDGTTTTAIYQVHKADFGEPPGVIAGTSRVWTPADIRHPLEVTADEGIELTPLESQAEEGAVLTFRVHNSATVAGPLCVVARLPGNGPIVATGWVHSLQLSTANQTGDAIVIGTLPDGTRVVEVSYIIDGPIPDDLSIWVRLYVTDAVFANGLTWLRLTAADFDENGVARFNVYKAPGTGTPYVCHWILPYADFEDVLNLRPVE